VAGIGIGRLSCSEQQLEIPPQSANLFLWALSLRSLGESQGRGLLDPALLLGMHFDPEEG
jgi:hypothetical protein